MKRLWLRITSYNIACLPRPLCSFPPRLITMSRIISQLLGRKENTTWQLQTIDWFKTEFIRTRRILIARFRYKCLFANERYFYVYCRAEMRDKKSMSLLFFFLFIWCMSSVWDITKRTYLRRALYLFVSTASAVLQPENRSFYFVEGT